MIWNQTDADTAQQLPVLQETSNENYSFYDISGSDVDSGIPDSKISEINTETHRKNAEPGHLSKRQLREQLIRRKPVGQ